MGVEAVSLSGFQLCDAQLGLSPYGGRSRGGVGPILNNSVLFFGWVACIGVLSQFVGSPLWSAIRVF